MSITYPLESSAEESKLFQEPAFAQTSLFENERLAVLGNSDLEKLKALLAEDLNFHNANTSYATHDFHAFPAKFPPQLPEKFILGLTQPGDVVLDPMMGSGTTILEAILHRRKAIGFDIDPLARLIAKVKTTKLNIEQLAELGPLIVKRAAERIDKEQSALTQLLACRWDKQTKEFVDYWFAQSTQIELLALIQEIEKVEEEGQRAFCELALSACIITKSGGVSLAFDLAHTRPHRAKVAYDSSGKLIVGDPEAAKTNPRVTLLTKKLRSSLVEFRKRFQQNLRSINEIDFDFISPILGRGNAQDLAIPSNSVDLVVTSPPYASNAIDYMRAHKFSLVWFDHSLDELMNNRKECIGGDIAKNFYFEQMPAYTLQIIDSLQQVDPQKGRALHRYFTEMKHVLREMFRVLRPGKCAIVVVASSIMRGKDTETGKCLSEIGRQLGFIVPEYGIRLLDRNRRMLPASKDGNNTSQIQQRMHEEFVIGFYKPINPVS